MLKNTRLGDLFRCYLVNLLDSGIEGFCSDCFCYVSVVSAVLDDCMNVRSCTAVGCLHLGDSSDRDNASCVDVSVFRARFVLVVSVFFIVCAVMLYGAFTTLK